VPPMWGSVDRVLSLFRRPGPLEVWHDDAFRLPLPSLEASAGVELRRVDFVAWFLLDRRAIRPTQLRTPAMITYEDAGRVHAASWLEALHHPETLARVFAVDPSEIAVDPILDSVRLGCGATLEAARTALLAKGPTLNLHGGFHHAHRAGGGGFCALNDIAIATAVLRAEGFEGQVCVLDLDAHPPDGVADCMQADPRVWIGSLSGSNWGTLENVDEVVLPEGTEDVAYLEALEGLLRRMPAPKLAFVIAGCDVLAGDRFGMLGLSLGGTRARDIRVAQALCAIPSVWLPGGGYHQDAWRVLAGSALVLAGQTRRRIPHGYDPLSTRYAWVSGQLRPSELQGELELSFEDLEAELAGRPPSSPRLLGYYTRSGIEYALVRMGLWGHLRRLGYEELHVELDDTDAGQRLRVLGTSAGTRHVLVEVVVERRRVGAEDVLFVNWLSLRNPRAAFTLQRPRLPGQDVPGPGMGREATALLGLMARRLGLCGVLFRPAWYHLAYAGRDLFHYVDPERQGRFEALVRDTSHLPLVEVTCAIAEGRVRMNGAPYPWEASDMMYRVTPQPHAASWRARADAERDRVRFELEQA
jgi:acetoin utilization deacetylase AcuC-like enzyme